ncbi:hypothetical protein CCAX7_008080 [Capsulimonas corticalis]|uniref:Uncharacterized protein n=1 Tax=Capsulimonas corticalis TaxID=2219043 RepID=A0A402CTU3_9BACT|nr:hypothetical protein [Capsulimonas corticalis]BDI28757.1 hypothetical protein CCAX7_008080 [Capsulimonas corticalis]
MLESDKWALLLGAPVIVLLVISIRRRIAALNRRISEIKSADENGPRNPYQDMADLLPNHSEQPTRRAFESRPRGDSKDNDG